LSRAQVTRLITGYQQTGRVTAVSYQRIRFPTIYTAADVELLAYVDRAHGNLSGPATRASWSGSTASMARLPTSGWRGSRWRTYTGAFHGGVPEAQHQLPANAAYAGPIGERRKPRPQGSPGYLRIDTVHQGDQDGCKGLYHINAVDEVTQWEIVAATPQISELWLLPVLEAILQQFPFVIHGFHSDNGSEFINYTWPGAGETTHRTDRSRPHRSGDNGLVESKNGAIIRKHIGYGYIAAQHAEAMDRFHREYLNPYSTSIGLRCATPSPRPTASAAGSTGVGPRPWSCSGNCLAASAPAPRRHPGRTGALRPTAIRHRSRAGHAACKRKLLGSVKRTQTA